MFKISVIQLCQYIVASTDAQMIILLKPISRSKRAVTIEESYQVIEISLKAGHTPKLSNFSQDWFSTAAVI